MCFEWNILLLYDHVCLNDWQIYICDVPRPRRKCATGVSEYAMAIHWHAFSCSNNSSNSYNKKFHVKNLLHPGQYWMCVSQTICKQYEIPKTHPYLLLLNIALDCICFVQVMMIHCASCNISPYSSTWIHHATIRITYNTFTSKIVDAANQIAEQVNVKWATSYYHNFQFSLL